MFIYRLHEHFHPPQCIMFIITTLLCQYMSYMVMIQQTKSRDLIPIIPNQHVLN